VGTLLGVSILVFVAIRLVPGDPVTVMLSEANRSDPALVEKFRIAYGLNQPLWVQYWDWIRHVVVGDFGQSITLDEPVSAIVWPRLGATLLLGSVASVIALTTGITYGVLATYIRGGRSRILKSLPLVGLAFPSFGVGVALVFVFAVTLHLLPPSGIQSPLQNGGVADVLVHTILPAVALSLYPAAFTARLVQGAMEEVRGEDYVRTARSLGVSPLRVATQHILPNAMLPVLTNGAVLIGYMITAAVFIESVFNWPGIGSMMVNAVLGRDYPVLEAGALVTALTYIVLSMGVDFLYGVADPRVNIRKRPVA
jgi:peptide/nickel transport system permease protein